MSIRKAGQIIAGTPRTTGGVEIGDIGFAPLGIDESLNLRRYLNGQVISQSQFTSFTNKVKAAVALYPSIATTETNWQAEKTNSKLGQCGKFVIDDTAGTIRLPCVVNAQGLVDLQYLGTIKNESLPNIKGSIAITSAQGFRNEPGVFSGAFKNGDALSASSAGENVAGCKADFNASRSSSTYQDNAPVQQEAVQYPYYIQVATGIEETLPAIREYKTNVPYVLGDSKYSETNPYNASWLESNGQYNSATVYPDLWSQLQVELNSSLNVGDTIEISGKTYVKRGLPVVLSSAAYTDYDFVVNTADQTFRLPLLNGEEDLPSNRYDDLTIQASGSTYTASANGFFAANGSNSSGFGYLSLYRQSDLLGNSITTTTGGSVPTKASIPSKKGDVVTLAYGNGMTVSNFRFTYAQGNGSLYYYVGDTVQDASLINAGAVLGQLSNKADIDASNFNASGKSLLSGLGMPSGRYIDLTLGASGSAYTAPANGWFAGWTTVGVGNSYFVFRIGEIANGYANEVVAPQGYQLPLILPIKKGTNMIVQYNQLSLAMFRFYYAEGEN